FILLTPLLRSLSSSLFPYTTLFRSFSIVNAVLPRPLPYAEPARLVSAESMNSLNPQREIDGVSPADFWDWKDQTQKSAGETPSIDRKSTRLNSSHVEISYAVFCLNK